MGFGGMLFAQDFLPGKIKSAKYAGKLGSCSQSNLRPIDFSKKFFSMKS